MISFSEVESAIARAVDEGRIGRPRFLRCILVTDHADDCGVAQSRVASLCERLIGSSSKTSYEAGRESGVFSSILLKWKDGEGALINVSVGLPKLDMMLLGSRGALYFDEQGAVGVDA